MKYISLFFTCLFICSCGNAKEASAMTTQTELAGNYNITSVYGNQLDSKDLLIRFSLEKKMISGFSRCNQFSGSYENKGAALNFSPLASTRKMCRPEANKTEQDILKALNETISFTENNQIITFYDLDNKVVMTLAKPEPSNSQVVDKQKDYKVEYTAISRGSYMLINYENSSIYFQKERNSKPQVKALSKSQIASLNAKIEALNLNELESLEPPSKAHQYDGAAIAGLKISTSSSNYQTPSFDAGNPPKTIEALVSELIGYIEKL